MTILSEMRDSRSELRARISLIVWGFVLAFVTLIPTSESRADETCRLHEARQIACAAATKSWEIDHSWPRAQGVFSTVMSHFECGESRKWDGVCR